MWSSDRRLSLSDMSVGGNDGVKEFSTVVGLQCFNDAETKIMRRNECQQFRQFGLKPTPCP